MKKTDAPNGRFYKPDDEMQGDKWFPSVTTIIGKTLTKGKYFHKWLANQPSWQEAEDYKNEKAEKGTKVHEYCERLALGEEVDVSDDSKEVRKKAAGYVNFHDKEDVNVWETEFQLAHPNYMYAGTADLLAEVNDELWLIDIKTSSNIYNSHKIQLSMYQRAARDTGYAEPDKQGILWLKDRTKKGYQLKGVDYRPQIVPAIMELYDFVGDWSPKKEEELPEKLSLEVEEDGKGNEEGD